MKIRFINETYIREHSPITDLVQAKDLFPHIDSAQFLYLRVQLGSGFYNYLLERYKNEDLNEDERELMLDYIKPALLWRTIELGLPFLHFQLRAKGLMQNTDDQGVPAKLEELKMIIHESKNRAEVAEDYLRTYLAKNGRKFPKYIQQDGLTSADNSTNFDSGLIFY